MMIFYFVLTVSRSKHITFCFQYFRNVPIYFETLGNFRLENNIVLIDKRVKEMIFSFMMETQ